MRGTARLIFAGVLLAAGMAPATGWAANPPRDERRAVARVISEWEDDCNASNRGDWDDMVDAWYDEITDDDDRPDGHGSRAWVRNGFHHNGSIVDSDFTDPDIVPWGNDLGDDRLDEDDVCMLGLHGRESDPDLRWKGKVRVDEAGAGNCSVWQGSIEVGDTDLEFLHLSSCHSLCADNITSWNATHVSGVHQITGFHGIMYITPFHPPDYEDFGDDVFDMSVAEAWVENLFDPLHWYEDLAGLGEGCPVALVAGFAGDIDERMESEQYNDVFSDPVDPDAFGTFWIGGCNPDDDPALPN